MKDGATSSRLRAVPSIKKKAPGIGSRLSRWVGSLNPFTRGGATVRTLLNETFIEQELTKIRRHMQSVAIYATIGVCPKNDVLVCKEYCNCNLKLPSSIPTVRPCQELLMSKINKVRAEKVVLLIDKLWQPEMGS